MIVALAAVILTSICALLIAGIRGIVDGALVCKEPYCPRCDPPPSYV